MPSPQHLPETALRELKLLLDKVLMDTDDAVGGLLVRFDGSVLVKQLSDKLDAAALGQFAASSFHSATTHLAWTAVCHIMQCLGLVMAGSRSMTLEVA